MKQISLIWSVVSIARKTISPRRRTRSLCAERESSGADGSIIGAFSMRCKVFPYTQKRSEIKHENIGSFGISLRGGVADDVEC